MSTPLRNTFFSHTILNHSAMRFAMVGAIGFLVDLSSMLLFSLWLSHTTARGLAFWVAASSNWWLNRHFTFACPTNNKESNKKAAVLQWMQFIGSSMLAFIPNWGCYVLLLTLQPLVPNPTISLLWPYLAMIPGVLIGMIANYLLARFWVFSSYTFK
ncbi:MAG: GtrA family protein [Marinomonas colpomeniae]